jgi:hypothetical protein
VSINYPTLHEELTVGNVVLVDDGKKKFEVVEIKGKEIKCKILVGGETKGRRSVNLPGANLKIRALTDKDKKDIAFGIKNKVDIIAFSFVKKASEVQELRDILNKAKSRAMIMSKIETPEAIENIDEIIEASDSIMIGRGDLAVEVGYEAVPGYQKMIIEKCNHAGKPVVTAPVTVICGAAADTYTASWDKASYKQGDIAKLTVSFKDIFGAPANSQSAVTALVSSLSNEVISTPMMTRVGSTSTAALNTDENGNLVYTYSVGTPTGVTPGAYQASVSFPTVNSAKGEAQAVAYTIASDGSVTNADVLKSIVSLIASINKQIQALQKLILRR